VWILDFYQLMLILLATLRLGSVGGRNLRMVWGRETLWWATHITWVTALGCLTKRSRPNSKANGLAMLKHLFPLFWAQKLSNIGTVGTRMGDRLMGLCSSPGKWLISCWPGGPVLYHTVRQWSKYMHCTHAYQSIAQTRMHLRSGVLGGRKSGCQALDQGVYIIRWDFNDYFMFLRVQLAPCRGRWCWKLAKIKLGLRTYWNCYMDVYSHPLEAHKIIWYFASLLHYYFLSFDTCKILKLLFCFLLILNWKTEQLPVKFTKPSVKKSENFLAQKW
jgi:hypothetical protein